MRGYSVFQPIFPTGVEPAPHRAMAEIEAGRSKLLGQVVLVMQGGALGAFQGGVYDAMHDAGIAGAAAP